MNQTPLCDALRRFAGQRPLRMHMPGHKGHFLPLPELSPAAALDVTELPPTGNLFESGGPIEAAEDLWARAFGSAHCLFLTGGSTQGVLSAFTLACRSGDQVLVDRGCHRSAFNAMALLDLHPHYLFRPWLREGEVTGPISPRDLEDALEAHPAVRAVCVTSPTYYGVCSDLPALARVCHAHGVLLLVDGAHGAHLPFLEDRSLAAADVAVVSAHKTLPAPGQSALLFSSRFSLDELRRAASLYGSSSPSYPMMAALDAARAWMEEEGRTALRRTAEQVARLRRRFPALTPEQAPLDPTRLVLRCADGFAAEKALQDLGGYPEMADARHVVFICTAADTEADFARLEEALSAVWTHQPPLSQLPPLPPAPAPEQALSPRQARFSSTRSLPVGAALDEIAASQVAPYPPGVPVLAPGERVTKKTIAYLSQIGYNMEKDMEVVLP
ncbi:aminotransferase class V-fold PLP-dependent enzyme [Pseudoflavonifractor gallinarum]|uniref:aminotransferase class I/II-fold pyridoxal phosphate-dependent enzyme n=1 Tax=Pseudoflavonifractor gallinarum TaxID=2779352 RepID=UPI0036F2BF4B